MKYFSILKNYMKREVPAGRRLHLQFNLLPLSTHLHWPATSQGKDSLSRFNLIVSPVFGLWCQ